MLTVKNARPDTPGYCSYLSTVEFDLVLQDDELIAVFWYGKSDSSAVVARGDYLEVNSPRGNKYIFGLNYNRVVTTLKRYCSPEAQRINVNLSLENYTAAVLYRAPSSKLVFNNCFGSAVKRIK
jgi:hypothetical protein